MNRCVTIRRPARGISLIEMLLALSITSVLLLAVGAAFDGSFKNYEQNQQVIDSLQGSRILMHRIMTQARQSTYLNVTDGGCRVEVETPADNYQYIYVYSAANQRVTLSRLNMGTTALDNLGTVDNVTAFSIPSDQWAKNPDRLTVSMTVAAGKNNATLSDSAVPRSTIAF